MFNETQVESPVEPINLPQGRQGFDDVPILSGLKKFDNETVKKYIEQQVIIIGDDSGSMSGAKANETTNAIKAVCEQLADPANKDNFRTSVITYGSTATLEHSSIAPENVSVTITGNAGGTSLVPALQLAETEIANFIYRENKKTSNPVILVMSDGQLGDFDEAVVVADRLKANKVKIIAIGFGSSANEEQLKKIATDAEHYSFADIGQLKPLFANVGKTLSMQNQTANA